MTIEELNKALDEMRTVYPFDNHNTAICICADGRSCTQEVRLMTFDVEKGTHISLTKEVKTDRTTPIIRRS